MFPRREIQNESLLGSLFHIFLKLPLNQKKLSRVRRRLDRPGSRKRHSLHRHMLVPGQKQIKIQLLPKTAGDILPAVGKGYARLQILSKPP